MRKITGLVASSGLALGKVYKLSDREERDIPLYSIQDVSLEKLRLQKAISETQSEMQTILKEYEKKTSNQESDELNILNTHLAMLSDEDFIQKVLNDVEKEKLNVETFLSKRLEEYANILATSPNAYIRERALDIKDAFEGVFDKLLSSREKTSRFKNVPKDSIIIATNIMPSEALALKDSQVKGIVMEEGGITGHISIIARSWGIPMLICTPHCMSYSSSGLDAILDAEKGFVIFNPSQKSIEEYTKKIAEKVNNLKNIEASFTNELVKTLDGVPISVSANIAFKDEIEVPSMKIADGIGLFRTEFLFLQDDKIPDEDMQYEVYSSVIKAFPNKKVLIRTFDAGSDKMLKEQESLHEKNPLLGWRAIRYCFARPDIFKTQLKAILRSAVFGNVHILIPMVSSLEEITQLKEILNEVKSELRSQNVQHRDDVPLGIMVEVPSIAVIADLASPLVDFMSIGTNDLVQYTMAADRENGKVSNLANYFEPSVLRLIKNTIDSKDKSINADYFVSMCGEMASNKEAVFLLLGMGLRSFSMPSWNIYEMKKFIASVSLEVAEKTYQKVMSISSPNLILKCIKEEIDKIEI
ncbi:MAG: phosphoenolpyruvate--protein phosphotransferase [Treponema sp.]